MKERKETEREIGKRGRERDERKKRGREEIKKRERERKLREGGREKEREGDKSLSPYPATKHHNHCYTYL